MLRWLHAQADSRNAQLASVAVASGLTVATLMLGVQALRRKIALDELKASIPNVDEVHDIQAMPDYRNVGLGLPLSKEDARAAKLAHRARNGDYDQELIDEQLTRTSSFLTPDGLAKLRSTFVVVIGLGGVGSHCTAALARSGVGRLRVVDFDQVSLSSLNRHAVATLSDVGTPKVVCIRRRLEASVPWIEWESFNEVWRLEQAERLLGPFGGPGGQRPDYVVDAIDNIDTKVALLSYCHSRAIRVVSSMGAGCKSDPTRVMVGDISGTAEDPLSRATRRRLKLAGVAEGITAVFSTEKPDPRKAQLLPLPDHEFERGSVGDLGVLPDFRARILPVIGTMPAVFGYTAANCIIMRVAGYPYEPGAGKARDKTYDTVLATLQAGEERLARLAGEDPNRLRIAVTSSDVGYLVDEVFRGRSVVSGLATKLVLCRWNAPADGFAADRSVKDQKASKLKMQDLVCMTKEEAAEHEKQVLLGGKRPEDVYSQEVSDLVAARLREERTYDRYR